MICDSCPAYLHPSSARIAMTIGLKSWWARAAASVAWAVAMVLFAVISPGRPRRFWQVLSPRNSKTHTFKKSTRKIKTTVTAVPPALNP